MPERTNEPFEYPLQVRDLYKTYRMSGGKSLEAVKGVSFQVKKGECFGLLGPNGAGKSTTIQCISGFYPATSGEVTVTVAMSISTLRLPAST